MNNGDKKTILLVEDEAIIAMFEKPQLEKKGYTVHLVTSGEKAVRAIVDNIYPIDLILMDIDLGSGIDGTEAAEQILNHKDIPVVFLSSHTEPEIVEKTEKITSYGYVVKNSGIVVLDASIKMAFKLFEAKQNALEAKEKAEESEARYHLVASNTSDSIWVMDADLRFTFLSTSTEKLFGYSLIEWETLDWNIFVNPDYIETIYNAFGKLKSGKERAMSPLSVPVRHKNGNEMWVEFSADGIYDKNNIFTGAVGITRDITERKQSEQNYKTLFNEMLNGFALHEIICDTSGTPVDYRFLNINPAFERMTGLKAKDVVGRKVLDVLPGIEHHWINTYGRVALTGEPVFFENFSGAIGKYFRVTAFCPSINRFACIFEDITERKQVEDALKESEENFKSLMLQSPFVVELYDLTGLQISVNKAYEELWNLPAEATLYKFNVLESKEVEETGLMAYVKRAYAGESVVVPEYVFDSRGETEGKGLGRIRWLNTRIYPLKDESGVVKNIVIVHQDITERKQAELKLQEEEENLRITLNSIGDAVISTDIEGRVVRMNLVAELLCGWSNAEAYGEKLEEVFYIVNAGTRKRVDNPVELVMRTGNIVGLANHTMLLSRDGKEYQIADSAAPITTAGSKITGVVLVFRDVTDQYEKDRQLHSMQWMLSEQKDKEKMYIPEYGDLTELNKNGLILSSLGKDQLIQISSEYLNLLETSSAVYEKNGDYALGMFSSGWCQLMDTASRELCGTDDNREALSCGKWLCHDSCWREASLKSIEDGQPVDIECAGGLHIYAVPIRANGKVIGAINFGYGNPPEDTNKLQRLSDLYKIPIQVLQKKREEYQARPQFIIEYAKKRIENSAQVIGTLVECKLVEDELLYIKKMHDETEKTGSIGGWEFDVVDMTQTWTEGTFRILEMDSRNGAPQVSDGLTFIVPSYKKMAEEAIQRAIENGESYDQEWEVITQKGNKLWVHSIGKPIQKQGKTIKLRGSFQDITVRKQTEKDLIESENRFKNMFEHHNAVMILIDPVTGSLINANEAATKYYGYSKSVLCAMKIDEINILQPEQIEIERNNAMQQNRNYFNFPHKLASGEIRTVEVHSSPIEYLGKRMLFSIIHDITERKRFEQDLIQQKQYLETIIKTASDGFWVVTPDKKITSANLAYCQMSGYSSDELAKMEINDLDVVESPQETAERIKRIIKNGSEIFETKHRRKDGSLMDVEVSTSILNWTDGMCFVCFCRDISDRKQAEEKIKKQITEKETLLREVHHRVKNNIATIEGFLSLQVDSNINSEVKSVLQTTISHVSSMRVLYDNLLRGNDYNEVSIKNYIDSLIASITTVFPCSRNITIEKQITDFKLNTNKAVIIGIALNEILTNAFKYAFIGRDTGKISVIISKVENHVTLTVQDNGVGLGNDFDLSKSSGFGINILKMFTESCTVENDRGTRVVLCFDI